MELDVINFKNLLIFYHNELNKIDSGIRASLILKYHERRRLKKYGILTETFGTRDTVKIKLTMKAKKLLKELDM